MLPLIGNKGVTSLLVVRARPSTCGGSVSCPFHLLVQYCSIVYLRVCQQFRFGGRKPDLRHFVTTKHMVPLRLYDAA